MKKLLTLSAALLSSFAHAAAYDPIHFQRDQWDISTFNFNIVQPASNADGMFIFDGTNKTTVLRPFGSGFSVVGGAITVAPTFASLTGKPTTVSGYGITDAFATPTGTTAQYIRGDGSLATLPTASTPSQSSASRSLNSAFQVSSSRPSIVTYSVQVTVTANIAGGQNGDVILEIASDSGFTSNVQTLSIAGTGQTYTLAVALQGVQPQTSVVSGFVPTGYYTRLRTVQNTGTPSFSYRSGQEVLL